jgi:hypothetical protein
MSINNTPDQPSSYNGSWRTRRTFINDLYDDLCQRLLANRVRATIEDEGDVQTIAITTATYGLVLYHHDGFIKLNLNYAGPHDPDLACIPLADPQCFDRIIEVAKIFQAALDSHHTLPGRLAKGQLMHNDGQLIAVYLGSDRQLYVNQSPGKHLCVFEGRIFLKADHGKDVISITKIPKAYDQKPVKPPPGCIVQGLD